ncbi:MAG TPA: NAD(P)-dependent oxidoreductase [Burkholderiaceae bacterium]|nr:NAD(P)-dependent oxidoreductase [Burkholderiaceae bacterium]
MPRLRIGVIGIGAMGLPIATNLHGKGHAVRVRDIREAALQAAAESGLAACASAREMASCCDLLIVVVVNAAQIEAVLFGPDGVVHGERSDAGPAVMLCSTIAPEDTARFGRRLAETGIATLDAPISGGPVRAGNGTMSIMVAGSSALVERFDGVLRDMAAKVFHVGETLGVGAKAKLVNNLLAGINLAAGAEALALGAQLGLDARQLFDVICASSGASWIFQDRMARALAGDFVPRAQTHILTKDVGLAVAMAASAGIETPLARQALRAFEAAVAAGLADEDDAAIIKAIDPEFGAGA